MEAGKRSILIFVFATTLGCVLIPCADAANFRTRNFIIQAPSPQLAQAVGEHAERYRTELSNYWLGNQLPNWPHPCPIRVITGPHVAAQGVTTYNLSPVRDFQMQVEGSPERILDSVLPHEITHTILATHFGRPLPRWADEGICTTVEHVSERSKHEAKLREFLSTRRGIAMNRLFLLTEYPHDVLPMYAQGYSVCRFLIDQKGPQTFIRFLQDYMQQRSWTANVRKHYGYDSLAELQEYWLTWVSEGSESTARFVKHNPKSNPKSDFGTRGLANRSEPKPLAQTVQIGSALEKTVDQGWYSRQRDKALGLVAHNSRSEVALNRPTDATTAIQSIRPPSVQNSGRYSVSQPRGEQQMSRAGQPSFQVINPPHNTQPLRRFR